MTLVGVFLTCTIFWNLSNFLDTPSFSENDKDNVYRLETDAVTLNVTLPVERESYA